MSADGRRLAQPVAPFAALYDADPDPWGFDVEPYEQARHEATIAALPRPAYRRGVEPGCANGSLTERLADRCTHVVAFDPVVSCVRRARRRLAGRPGVSVLRAALPAYWPPGACDLAVLSEVAYYLTDDGMALLLERLERALEPGGTLVAVHFTGPNDHLRSARQVHDDLRAVPWLRPVARRDEGRYLLDVLERAA